MMNSVHHPSKKYVYIGYPECVKSEENARRDEHDPPHDPVKFSYYTSFTDYVCIITNDGSR